MKKENIVLIMKRIKKEHFIKTILWVAGIVLTLFWIAFVIATSISAGKRTILSEIGRASCRERV